MRVFLFTDQKNTQGSHHVLVDKDQVRHLFRAVSIDNHTNTGFPVNFGRLKISFLQSNRDSSIGFLNLISIQQLPRDWFQKRISNTAKHLRGFLRRQLKDDNYFRKKFCLRCLNRFESRKYQKQPSFKSWLQSEAYWEPLKYLRWSFLQKQRISEWSEWSNLYNGSRKVSSNATVLILDLSVKYLPEIFFVCVKQQS